MKIKIIEIMLLFALTAGFMSACKNNTTESKENKNSQKDDAYQYVSADDAVKAENDENIHIVDLREWKDYVKGRLKNSEWQAIFPLENDELEEEMKSFAKAHLNDDKKIYLVCYSGNRGAKKATKALEDAGIAKERIYTVEGGAKALADKLSTDRTEENIKYNYVSGADAAEKIGDKDVQFIDVRDKDSFDKGHIEGSILLALKETTSPEAQDEVFKYAEENLKKDKPVYILCYRGKKCAKTAVSILRDAGFNNDEVFIIENGAENEDIKTHLIK